MVGLLTAKSMRPKYRTSFATGERPPQSHHVGCGLWMIGQGILSRASTCPTSPTATSRRSSGRRHGSRGERRARCHAIRHHCPAALKVGPHVQVQLGSLFVKSPALSVGDLTVATWANLPLLYGSIVPIGDVLHLAREDVSMTPDTNSLKMKCTHYASLLSARCPATRQRAEQYFGGLPGFFGEGRSSPQ